MNHGVELEKFPSISVWFACRHTQTNRGRGSQWLCSPSLGLVEGHTTLPADPDTVPGGQECYLFCFIKLLKHTSGVKHFIFTGKQKEQNCNPCEKAVFSFPKPHTRVK